MTAERPPADVRVVKTDDAYDDAVAVRMAVFVDEQGVPEELELDDHEAEAVHFVAYESSDHDHDGPGHHHDDPGDPIGAARLREPEDGVGKVERVAVLESHRGRGVGGELMATAESVAAARDYDRLVLHAQTTATGFYERLGYERVGDAFQEDGIEHVEMRKEL